MARLLDFEGAEALVGQSTGYWHNDSDFISTADLKPDRLGNLGFPRDWPGVYSTSKALKSLIGKKGRCAGKKVGVVPEPLPEETAKIGNTKIVQMNSFSNAERVQKDAGLDVVRGWAIYEHLDLAMSEAFVAERYWWNAMPDGKWVDFTPRPSHIPEMLLAEAANDASKTLSKLSMSDVSLTCCLFKQRYGLTLDVKDSPQRENKKGEETKTPSPKPTKFSTEVATPPKESAIVASSVPVELRDLVGKVQSGDANAVNKLELKLSEIDSGKTCLLVATDALLRSVANMLTSTSPDKEEALKLLVVLSDAAVDQRDTNIGSTLLDLGVANALVELMAPSVAACEVVKERAAAALGNLCHESPANQDKVARVEAVFPTLVELANNANTGPAQEAAYAIWNLTVGHEDNSAKFAKLDVVRPLTALLRSVSDIAQENAAGALMHVTIVEEAKSAILAANTIPRLCELLKPAYEPEASCQAAGALLNLASDCQEYAKIIVKEGVLKDLVRLIKDGPDLAREYAAGALMNVIRVDPEVAQDAAKNGAIAALAQLIAKPFGNSEALGALANLASGSPERRIEIYKNQVTRRTVNMLSNADVDIRRSAAALIMNMAPQSKIKERIVEAGALKPLAVMLTDEDHAVKERAAGSLANLFNDHPANVNAGFSQAPEMIPSLVAFIQQPAISDDAKRQATHALAMLAAEDGPCDEVWSAGAGPAMMALLEEGVAEAALGLMNLSWRWPEVKQDLAKGNAIDNLSEMLRSSDSTAREYATGAFMNMTAGSIDNAEKSVGVVQRLIELLQEESVQCAEWAAGALANILRAVGRDIQKIAADAGAATGLAALLPKVSSSGKSLVVLGLAALAEEQASLVAAALKGSKEKQKIREFRNSGDEELQDYVNMLVEKLGKNFTL